ncbi:hypothetical protein [Dictyobacter kobayashii]|uniref:HTH cro/C1-type domain-containing protein n=1 Tax=Dictyobacter kobayashii TaxID=2014872 RepID=A0A402AYY2_9CHLR|nr:hypothetical protein [Dictyobacter kobayashii]GCE24316.1 hypothetical protein KDK_81160 [Dictyobacter kobayashii]
MLPKQWSSEYILRDLLAQIIQDEKIKLNLVDALGISPVTLTRWITGKSDPRPQNLRHLINTLPTQYHEQMYALLRHENKLTRVSLIEENLRLR